VLRDAEGVITFVNDAYCALAQLPGGTLVGSRFALTCSSRARLHENPTAPASTTRRSKTALVHGGSLAGRFVGLQCRRRAICNASAASHDRTETERALGEPATMPTRPTAPSRASWRWLA